MAAAPILGSFLNIYFGWQANFFLLAVLASLSFLDSYFYLVETLVPENRILLSWQQALKDYGTVLTSFPYMAAACIAYFLLAGMIVFVANLSLSC
jgi:DHA1 family bicyclomycin/chloramphenicol resistance-like MFS transporter